MTRDFEPLGDQFRDAPSSSIIPRATYRLQLTKDFTFAQTGALGPYLQRLGISHAYLSPILKARTGSTHGYDTVDHTVLNPELGTRADFEEMAINLRRHGIGIVLDIVPNHMGVGGDENPQWLDVLEHGRASPYADWFDINWTPDESALQNKVLVPFLRTSFAEALGNGAIELRYDASTDTLAIWAEGIHKLPLRRDTYAMVSGSTLGERCASVADLNSPERQSDLLAIIDAQHWKLARFSAAADDINYRRFFIVSDLAGIRVERDDVFDHVHQLTFELIEQGLVQGLRVDHIDGLYDPKAYCLALRRKSPRPIYLVVEKILAPSEMLRPEWGVDGTTGYEFAGAITRLLVDPAGVTKLTEGYQAYTGQNRSFADVERDAKRQIIDFEMTAELDSLATRLRAIAVQDLSTADLPRHALRSVLREVVASMPVYRTYVDSGDVGHSDRRFIALAVNKARQTLNRLDPATLDFVAKVLSGDWGREHPRLFEQVIDAARRIQQYTGPVMAKGLEDTALYRYNRLIALSDVGEKPDGLSESIDAFHDFNAARREKVPAGLLTSSSHDSKRGEDARARIAALSGCAGEWIATVADWTQLLEEADAPEIEPNDRYYFFQLLLGAWPQAIPVHGELDGAQLKDFGERLDAAMRKSVRESRVRTNWNNPDADYESAVAKYVQTALDPHGDFLGAFRLFEASISSAGAQNGLIETVLKLTVPGVPDIYQGAEFWEQSMVDPDNRRAVDFASRIRALAQDATYSNLIPDVRDGRIKQRVIADLLAVRANYPDVFLHGSYEPVVALKPSVCSFVRRFKGTTIFVAVQLYPWRGVKMVADPFPLPGSLCKDIWRPVLGNDQGTLAGVDASNLFKNLPMTVLISNAPY